MSHEENMSSRFSSRSHTKNDEFREDPGKTRRGSFQYYPNPTDHQIPDDDHISMYSEPVRHIDDEYSKRNGARRRRFNRNIDDNGSLSSLEDLESNTSPQGENFSFMVS